MYVKTPHPSHSFVGTTFLRLPATKRTGNSIPPLPATRRQTARLFGQAIRRLGSPHRWETRRPGVRPAPTPGKTKRERARHGLLDGGSFRESADRERSHGRPADASAAATARSTWLDEDGETSRHNTLGKYWALGWAVSESRRRTR